LKFQGWLLPLLRSSAEDHSVYMDYEFSALKIVQWTLIFPYEEIVCSERGPSQLCHKKTKADC